MRRIALWLGGCNFCGKTGNNEECIGNEDSPIVNDPQLFVSSKSEGEWWDGY